jgi:hypothetical protein
VYGLEYELVSRQGWLSSESDQRVTSSSVVQPVKKKKALEPAAAACGTRKRSRINLSISIPSSENLILVSKKGLDEGDHHHQWDCMGGGGGSSSSASCGGEIGKKKKKNFSQFHVNQFKVRKDVMKNKFHIEKLSHWLKKLLKVVMQEEDVLYSRYLDACEKRNQVLAGILKRYKAENNNRRSVVCLLTVAAKLEYAIKQSALKEASLQNVQCYRDPFEYLKVYSDQDVDAIVEKVLPYIYRLFSVLRTLDANKYKGNNIPWMLLGMLYICMTGMTIGVAEVLPCISELCNILPVDNRIVFYFGSFGINTKCVTDISNMINVTLKDQYSALKVLADV